MSQFKNPEAPRRLGHWMRHAGFADVEERSTFLGFIPLNIVGHRGMACLFGWHIFWAAPPES